MPRGLQHRISAILVVLAALHLPATTYSAPNTTRPNILLLVAEDLSPRIGAWDDPVASTPNLDKLASQSVRYTNVFTNG